MGILSTEDGEGYLESVVFFLSDALRAAIEIGDGLQQTACEIPQIGIGMNCSEIADRLAAFRQRTDGLWGQEVLLVSKLMRARTLVMELRELDPELRPEIDTFRLATVSIPDLQTMLMPNVQRRFNGGSQPKRFLEERGHGFLSNNGRSDPVAGYRIAGHTDVRLLMLACETLHFGLAARYGFDSVPVRVLEDEAEADAPLAVEHAPADQARLSDFGDLPGDTTRPWLPLEADQRARLN